MYLLDESVVIKQGTYLSNTSEKPATRSASIRDFVGFGTIDWTVTISSCVVGVLVNFVED